MLLKIEIIVFFLSFFYVVYYSFLKINKYYFSVKKNIKKEEISNVKTALNKVDLNIKENNIKQENIHLSNSEKLQISEILKRVKLNFSKWYYKTAKSLIVEWLAIDKNNKELNLELADIYIEEENHKNAKYIYEDLLKNHSTDFEIIKKLADIHFFLWENKEALEKYEFLYNKKSFDLGVLEMLSEIYFTENDIEKSLKYVKKYLKDKPRDVEKLTLKAVCLEKLRKFKEANETYDKVLDLHPYDTFAKRKKEEISKYL